MALFPLSFQLSAEEFDTAPSHKPNTQTQSLALHSLKCSLHLHYRGGVGAALSLEPGQIPLRHHLCAFMDQAIV